MLVLVVLVAVPLLVADAVDSPAVPEPLGAEVQDVLRLVLDDAGDQLRVDGLHLLIEVVPHLAFRGGIWVMRGPPGLHVSN